MVIGQEEATPIDPNLPIVLVVDLANPHGMGLGPEAHDLLRKRALPGDDDVARGTAAFMMNQPKVARTILEGKAALETKLPSQRPDVVVIVLPQQYADELTKQQQLSALDGFLNNLATVEKGTSRDPQNPEHPITTFILTPEAEALRKKVVIRPLGKKPNTTLIVGTGKFQDPVSITDTYIGVNPHGMRDVVDAFAKVVAAKSPKPVLRPQIKPLAARAGK